MNQTDSPQRSTFPSPRLRRSLSALIGSSVLALSITSMAHAQTQGPASGGGTTPEAQADDLIVTASRIQRSGFTAPTPTTVVDSSNFQARAAVNVADALNVLPSFRGATSPKAASLNQSGAGATFLDLRGLGATRTLVLVNGRRHVASNAQNQVDVSLIPSLLVDRTEVVTGGASAAYGSDAVAGVVNFILQKDLVGVRGTAQYGVTDLGDGKNRLFGLAGGFNFAGDRGHFLIGGEYSKDDGLPYSSRERRAYWIQGRDKLTNSARLTNGQPQFIYARNVQYQNQYPGGLITGVIGAPTAPTATQQAALSGLIGTTFGNNGTLGRLSYGQVYGTLMIGGSAIGNNFSAQQDIVSATERYSVMGRLDYKLTDAINFNVEFSRAQNKASSATASFRDAGSASGATANPLALVARIDNPFMPTALRNQLVAAGVSAVYVGRDAYDIDITETDPRIRTSVRNKVTRGVVGLDGELGVGNFKWDAYYQYGESRQDEVRPNNRLLKANDPGAPYRLATDVVTGPTGAPICRSTLTNPNNGCVPFNIFGPNAASAAARAYVTATAELHAVEKQHVASLNVSGDLFDTWAGPVSIATGAEYRQDKAYARVDANSAASNFEFTNSQPYSGKITVKEIYGEAVIPLLKDVSFVKSFDLNLAGRYTDYSTSGGVFTWKVGGTWEVVDQLRFRGTLSRDIRAANISELYATNSSGGFIVANDRVLNNNNGAAIPQIAVGNPDLTPERSTTYTLGAVFTPEFARGLRFSVDYFDISIKDQIARVAGQTSIDRCAAGAAFYCTAITRSPTGFITSISQQWLNLSKFETNGIDFELAFARPLSDFAPSLPGNFALRVLATWTQHLQTDDGFLKTDTAGQLTGNATVPNVPHWTGFGSLTYNLDRFSTTVQGRYVGGGNIDNLATPGTATSANIYKVKAKTYWTLSASYDLLQSDDGKKKLQLFGVADNLFDSHPPFPYMPSSLTTSPYHTDLGRSYRFGVRFTY